MLLMFPWHRWDLRSVNYYRFLHFWSFLSYSQVFMQFSAFLWNFTRLLWSVLMRRSSQALTPSIPQLPDGKRHCDTLLCWRVDVACEIICAMQSDSGHPALKRLQHRYYRPHTSDRPLIRLYHSGSNSRSCPVPTVPASSHWYHPALQQIYSHLLKWIFHYHYWLIEAFNIDLIHRGKYIPGISVEAGYTPVIINTLLSRLKFRFHLFQVFPEFAYKTEGEFIGHLLSGGEKAVEMTELSVPLELSRKSFRTAFHLLNEDTCAVTSFPDPLLYDSRSVCFLLNYYEHTAFVQFLDFRIIGGIANPSCSKE